jgi:hypothetical protein
MENQNKLIAEHNVKIYKTPKNSIYIHFYSELASKDKKDYQFLLHNLQEFSEEVIKYWKKDKGGFL